MEACKKEIHVSSPSADVTIANTQAVQDTFTYKLGDTVRFMITGNAENIAVYTGDAGHNYAYRNRSTVTGAVPELSFTSTLQWGAQSNTLKVLATNSLLSLDSADIVNADWTDITNRATLATSATATNSGIIRLDDIVKNPTDSLMIAFLYTGATGSTQRTWTITNYVVNALLPDSTELPVSTTATANAYWTKFKIDGSSANWTSTTAQLQVVGGNATAPNNTSWIVSQPLYVNQVAPDASVPIKNIGSPDVPEYDYAYAATGTYTATFVIFNSSADDEKTVIKQFNIKVTQ
ncbi:hypothetical protein A9P82_04335 [Arachidicoccus ginsenosidimutans]|nr:hypothetical protein A9P82_04335 [Arachidicoccus sp. BS20]